MTNKSKLKKYASWTTDSSGNPINEDYRYYTGYNMISVAIFIKESNNGKLASKRRVLLPDGNFECISFVCFL